MGPKADQKKKGPAMQDTRKEASPDWVAEGGIHSAANPNPGRANAEFDQKRLMLALVAHKVDKTQGPPSLTEREKSPVTTGDPLGLNRNSSCKNPYNSRQSLDTGCMPGFHACNPLLPIGSSSLVHH